MIGLSIITVPRPFEKMSKILQRNALSSWYRLPAELDLVFLDPDKRLGETVGAKVIRGFERNERGYVTMRDLFLRGEGYCDHDIIAFVNTDIILMPSLVSCIETVLSLLEDDAQFLLICGRSPINVSKEIVDFEDLLKGVLATKNRFYLGSGQDLFVYRKGLWPSIRGELPPFGLGGAWWDNWFCWAAENLAGATVVDISLETIILHQDHVPGEQLTRENNLYNASLYQDIGWYAVDRAPYYLSGGQLIRRERPEDNDNV